MSNPPFRCGLLWILLATLPCLAAPLAAQAGAAGAPVDPVARCASEEHRQFDFWIGDWEVLDTAGNVVGHNEIRAVSGGCALLEDWRSAGPGRGMSINAYDPDRGLWTQRWVGTGASLWLAGTMEAGAMVLSGSEPRQTPQGAVLDRITWTPRADGSVRQVWEVSADGGAGWALLFEGIYVRVSSPGSTPTPFIDERRPRPE